MSPVSPLRRYNVAASGTASVTTASMLPLGRASHDASGVPTASTFAGGRCSGQAACALYGGTLHATDGSSDGATPLLLAKPVTVASSSHHGTVSLPTRILNAHMKDMSGVVESTTAGAATVTSNDGNDAEIGVTSATTTDATSERATDAVPAVLATSTSSARRRRRTGAELLLEELADKEQQRRERALEKYEVEVPAPVVSTRTRRSVHGAELLAGLPMSPPPRRAASSVTDVNSGKRRRSTPGSAVVGQRKEKRARGEGPEQVQDKSTITANERTSTVLTGRPAMLLHNDDENKRPKSATTNERRTSSPAISTHATPINSKRSASALTSSKRPAPTSLSKRPTPTSSKPEAMVVVEVSTWRAGGPYPKAAGGRPTGKAPAAVVMAPPCSPSSSSCSAATVSASVSPSTSANLALDLALISSREGEVFTVNPIETTKKKRGRPRKNPHVLPPAQPVDDRRNDLFIADLAETSVAECVQVDDGHGGTQSIMLPSYFSDAFLTTEVVATSSATTTATSTIAIPSRMYGTPQSDSSAYAYRPLTSDNMLNASPALPCAHKPPSAATVIGGGQHTHPPSRGMIEDSLPTLIVDALGRDMLFTMSDGTHDGAAHDHRTHDHGPNSGGDADATILADFANRIPWADFPLQ